MLVLGSEFYLAARRQLWTFREIILLEFQNQQNVPNASGQAFPVRSFSLSHEASPVNLVYEMHFEKNIDLYK